MATSGRGSDPVPSARTCPDAGGRGETLRGRLRGLETCLPDQQRGTGLCDGNGLVLGSGNRCGERPGTRRYEHELRQEPKGC